jgi:hypothetical protein
VFHEPDVHVWEQDGYMMYVKSDNKGKDGYYEAQITKMPDDENGKTWLRYYMKDHGQEPQEAWKNFWSDTVDVSRMQLAMISNAIRAPQILRVGTPKSSFGEAPTPSPRVKIARIGNPPPPPENIGGGGGKGARGPNETIVSHPPPMPKQPAAKVNIEPQVAPQKSKPGTPTGADSQPPLPPPKTPGSGKTLPGAFYRRQRQLGRDGIQEPGPKIDGIPTKSGQKLTPEQVIHIKRVDSNRIGWTMSANEHAAQWKAANPGSKEPPPIAFTTRDGRVVVNEEAWVKSGQRPLWAVEPE